MRTFVASAKSVDSRWHVIDAGGQVLGRVASRAAKLLQGKHKAVYTPFIDTGDHVVVVSWRYHLPRARYIFDQCFAGEVTMQAVPRTYDFSLVHWEYTYLYQLAGFTKAAIQGDCQNLR